MIIGLSPEPSGYGSPQQNHLMQSLRNSLNSDSLLVVPNAPFGRTHSAEFETTFVGEHDPWSFQGALERARFTKDLINRDTKILVLVNPASLLVVPMLKSKPHIVYLGLEPYLDHGHDFQRAFLSLARHVDTYVYPNFSRAKIETDRAFLEPEKIFVTRNANPIGNQPPSPLADRDTDFIYTGNLDSTKVDLDALIAVASVGLTKVFGDLKETSIELKSAIFQGLKSNEEVLKETRLAKFSLTLWKPNSVGRVNAAPNKIYNSLAAGTPIVSFPYPEAREIVSRYGCGILSSDFTPESMFKAGEAALNQVSMGNWEAMSNAAFRAFREEYNWEYQIKPVVSHVRNSL
jgi:glycosyltransferase involved in cell wall biosynthesis